MELTNDKIAEVLGWTAVEEHRIRRAGGKPEDPDAVPMWFGFPPGRERKGEKDIGDPVPNFLSMEGNMLVLEHVRANWTPEEQRAFSVNYVMIVQNRFGGLAGAQRMIFALQPGDYATAAYRTKKGK